jgi:hypothetical protein
MLFNKIKISDCMQATYKQFSVAFGSEFHTESCQVASL